MQESLKKKFEELEAIKADALESVKGLDENQINQPGAGEKWSIGQVLFHVHLAEKVSVGYILKKSTDLSQLKQGGMLEKFKSWFLNTALAMPIKYNAPKLIFDPVPEHVDWQELLTEWDETRQKLKQILSNLPAGAEQLKIFRHPLIGLINMEQALTFLQAHFKHHLPQVKHHLSNTKAD